MKKLNPPTYIAYFRSLKIRNAGKLHVIIYYGLRSDGTIRSVDVTRNITKTMYTFGSNPKLLTLSNEQEFNRALEIVTNS